MNIGERLEKLRKEKDWSKTYAAEKLGIKSMSTYANWEYGNREPNVEMLIKIADLYEVSLDYLVGRIEPPSQEKHDKELIDVFMDSKLSTLDIKEFETTLREFEVFHEYFKVREKYLKR